MVIELKMGEPGSEAQWPMDSLEAVSKLIVVASTRPPLETTRANDPGKKFLKRLLNVSMRLAVDADLLLHVDKPPSAERAND